MEDFLNESQNQWKTAAMDNDHYSLNSETIHVSQETLIS